MVAHKRASSIASLSLASFLHLGYISASDSTCCGMDAQGADISVADLPAQQSKPVLMMLGVLYHPSGAEETCIEVCTCRSADSLRAQPVTASCCSGLLNICRGCDSPINTHMPCRLEVTSNEEVCCLVTSCDAVTDAAWTAVRNASTALVHEAPIANAHVLEHAQPSLHPAFCWPVRSCWARGSSAPSVAQLVNEMSKHSSKAPTCTARR